jgi:hypothetical protein
MVSVPISKGVGALLNFAQIRIREDMKNRRQGAWRGASAACWAKKSETPSSPRHHLAVDDSPAVRKACERLDDARHAARLAPEAPRLPVLICFLTRRSSFRSSAERRPKGQYSSGSLRAKVLGISKKPRCVVPQWGKGLGSHASGLGNDGEDSRPMVCAARTTLAPVTPSNRRTQERP